MLKHPDNEDYPTKQYFWKQIKYRPDTPLVLRGISCTFEGGHRIGIVGRTGSGKTTLIGALFRLVEPVGGKIVVDGIDISTIGLHDLRSRFGIIPQEPTLFNGTVRFNLDPLSQHTDHKIWEVIFQLLFLVNTVSLRDFSMYFYMGFIANAINACIFFWFQRFLRSVSLERRFKRKKRG